MAKRKLAKPFVITVSLASLGAMVACKSSDSTDTTSGGSSGSSGSSGTSGIVNPPEMNDCPATKPAGDTPCAENGVKCDYGTPTFGCPDPFTQGHVECQSGLWNAPSSEPECAYPGAGCPATASAAKGADCPPDAGVCLYPDCTGVVNVSFSCSNGKLEGTPPGNCGGSDAGDGGG